MRSPIVYEVNTRCWLRELSERAGHPVTLSDVPDCELERWRSLGFTHVWLMGVWQVGEGARAVALRHWRDNWRNEGPSTERDVHGSPFAIREYAIDSRLGEPISLLLLKERLAIAGMSLILDFVPNHFGLDSSEPLRHPARFVQASSPVPGTFEVGGRHFAHGRDPYFPPWTDTIQLDYRVAETQQAMAATAQTISMFGYGLRCDMAMLLLPDVFEKTWKSFPVRDVEPAMASFWRTAIPAIRQLQPRVDLIAEAYWDREQELQDLGFDFTYNKKVYDFIVRRQFVDLQAFLSQCTALYLRRSVHFLENHDEVRAASTLSLQLHKAAALLILSLPGMAMLHDGQLEGRTKFAHIQMNKRATEQPDPRLAPFYENLLKTLQATYIRRGSPEVLNSHRSNVIGIAWSASPAEMDLAVINLTNRPETFVLDARASTAELLYRSEADLDLRTKIDQGRLILDLPRECGVILRVISSP